MPNTYELISQQSLSASASTVSFLSIPGTFKDLKIVWSARQDTGAAVAAYVSFNGSTANFAGIYVYTNGTGSASTASLARYIGSVPGANNTASTFGNSDLYISNYSSANNKAYSVENVDENYGVGNDQNLIAGSWSNTAAITSIAITPASGNFIASSTFYLYGIKNS